MADIIFFDGVCNLCNGWVQFVLKRDKGKFRFAPLQSEAAARCLNNAHVTDGFDSIVLYHDGTVSTKSTAVLEMLKRLRWPWPLLYAFVIIPKSVRDCVYDWVAENRYDWFGQRQHCMVPDEDVKERFLQ